MVTADDLMRGSVRETLTRYSGPCVYIAGAYSGEDYNAIDRNISVAREHASILARAGVKYVCPHQHSQHMEAVVPEVGYEFWMELYLHLMVQSCNAILLLPRWSSSSGAKREYRVAKEMGFPVFYLPEDAIAWAKG